MKPIDYLKAHPTLAGLEPYFVTSPRNREHFNTSPFGLQINEQHIINPMRSESELFCDLLLKLDAATFGPEGMPMDKWVFYDICYMPGAVFGFGIRSTDAPQELKELFQLTTNEEILIPVRANYPEETP